MAPAQELATPGPRTPPRRTTRAQSARKGARVPATPLDEFATPMGAVDSDDGSGSGDEGPGGVPLTGNPLFADADDDADDAAGAGPATRLNPLFEATPGAGEGGGGESSGEETGGTGSSGEEEEEEEEGEEDSDAEALAAVAESMAGFLGTRGKPGDVMRLGAGSGARVGDDEMLRWEPDLGALGPGGGPRARGCNAAHAAAVARGARGKEAGLAKASVVPPRDERRRARAERASRPETKGRGWFDLPAQTLDAETKNDLRVLKLRGAYDPKRFYRAQDETKLPKFFQMGTVVESGADFYSSRMAKRDRKRTLAEEILHDSEIGGYRKRKYARLQEEAERWSKPRGKKGGRKGLRRDVPKPRRPKH